MQVKITKKFEINKPVSPVWGFLSDPKRVATCVPGAQITEALDNRRYVGTVSVQVGPVVTSYRGELVIERMDHQNFEMELAGTGLDVKGKGSASMKMVGKLRALNPGSTEVEGSSEISVTGVMAQFGSRVVEEVSHRMFEQFTQSLRKNIEGLEGSATEETASRPIKAIPVLATASKTAIVDFFRRLRGRSKER